MTVFEAYITNLGKYAEGQLVGETLKFPATTEEVQSLLKNIGVDGVQYDSLKVMLEAVEKFGPDRAAIKDYIYTLKDWQGVSGTITMSDVGTPMRDIYIVKVEDGKFVQVDGVILKSTGVVYE